MRLLFSVYLIDCNLLADNGAELVNEHTHLKHSYIDCDLCSGIMSRLDYRRFNDAISKVKTAGHACMYAD